MRILAFILLFFFGLINTPHFKLIEATKQNVVGGRKESGRSVVYNFKLVVRKSSDKIQLEDVWIGVKHFSIKASHQDADNSISSNFDKGDTIYFQAEERYLPNENGDLELQKSTNPKNVPIEYKGNALIGYKYKGKQV